MMPSFISLLLLSSSLASICLGSSSNSKEADYIAIRQTLNRYPLALDEKDFGLLSAIFTDDAVADYNTGLGVLTGLSNIQSGLNASLFSVSTQHALSTQVVDFSSGGSTANSTTYFTASHFPRNSKAGDFLGQAFYAYGKYLDTLVKVNGKHDEAAWKIKHRQLVYLGPFVGNFSVYQS